MSEQELPPLSEHLRTVLLDFLAGGRAMYQYGKLFVQASESEDRQFEQDVEAWKAWLKKERQEGGLR